MKKQKKKQKQKQKGAQETSFDNQKKGKTLHSNTTLRDSFTPIFFTKLTSHLFFPTFILSHNFSSRHFECYPKLFLFNFTEFQLVVDLILFLIKII